MNISVSCPQCQKRYSLDETLAGKRIKCGQCGQITTVPAPTKPKPAPVPAPASALAPSGLSAVDLYGLDKGPAQPKAALAREDQDEADPLLQRRPVSFKLDWAQRIKTFRFLGLGVWDLSVLFVLVSYPLYWYMRARALHFDPFPILIVHMIFFLPVLLVACAIRGTILELRAPKKKGKRVRILGLSGPLIGLLPLAALLLIILDLTWTGTGTVVGALLVLLGIAISASGSINSRPLFRDFSGTDRLFSVFAPYLFFRILVSEAKVEKRTFLLSVFLGGSIMVVGILSLVVSLTAHR